MYTIVKALHFALLTSNQAEINICGTEDEAQQTDPNHTLQCHKMKALVKHIYPE